MEFKVQIEKLVGASNWNKWKRQNKLFLRHNDVHDVLTGDRECPSLPADASSELISAYEKGQESFVKDDSLDQLILVGKIGDSNIELAAICNIAESVWERMLSVYEQSCD
ncbi:hypothetical protein AVEN_81827-1 [Araneus ventricosus]|uniref:Uncharacterized protein n=1 Tax=Araneus ventricosus TaxID=182803 RepID=A0A4Y2TTX0_ARAVE|nr:hypothetical protein AVEN_81827-1 [Araneus ventricosus]